jgi:alcohol dehydrogenase, propanol-preferring
LLSLVPVRFYLPPIFEPLLKLHVGGLGQIATQIGKAKGYKVAAIDINDATLEVCTQQGADAVFNSQTNKDFAEQLKKVTNGGAKAACVFSNAQAVRSVDLA